MVSVGTQVYPQPRDIAFLLCCCCLVQVAYHGPIVKFAVRGCGQPGPRPVSAPLSDPTAIPDMSQVPAADAALRHVVHALLVGVEAKQLSPHALQVRGCQGTCCMMVLCTLCEKGWILPPV